MRWWLGGLVCISLSLGQMAHGATVKVQVSSELEVFAQPSLSSKVIETVPPGQHITMKTDKVIGSGGLGVFYKVKTQKGRIGFVVDSDLPRPGDPMPTPVAPAPVPPRPPPPPRARESAPAPAESAWGVAFGAANFTEKFAEENRSATQLFFGLRWTGSRGSFLGGRPDLGFVLSPNAPKFLSAAGASGKTSGFILLVDPSVLYDLVGGKSFSLYLGGGPLLGYSKYSTNYNGLPKDSGSFKFGAVADLGVAVDFSSGIVRLDIRYFVESSAYPGAFLTFQLYL